MNLFRRLTDKPWLRHGPMEDLEGGPPASPVPARTALYWFLAVISSLFFLFLVAYRLRMAVDDWRPLPEPDLLWINTGLLVLASLAMQWASASVNRARRGATLQALGLGGVLTLAFLCGQVLAWQQLAAAGFGVRGNPANAFFYLLTAVHGLHMAGGLWVWARTTWRAFRGAEAEDLRLTVQLCAVYWHFLLLVWLVVFAFLLSS